MILRSLSELDCGRHPALAQLDVKGVTCDSRSVAEGFVFVAVAGTRADGASFIADAIARGACAVVVDESVYAACQVSCKTSYCIPVENTRLATAMLAAEFYGNPGKTVNVVGITGTNGKTTVSYLIETICRYAGESTGVIGTINYRFADRNVESSNTTPGSAQLQELLAQMRESGVRYCALEVSSHALSQERTAYIPFHSAVFTNFTQDHLDYHKTMRQYFDAKSSLFRSLSSDAYAVINNDDDYGRMMGGMSQSGLVTYALDTDADIIATNIHSTINETSFVVRTRAEEFELRTVLIGRHNIYNILAATAWALQAGIGISDIQKAVSEFLPVPGRLERVDGPEGVSVFIDYAHTDDALMNVLTTLRTLSPRRIIVVFGCGGDRDRSKRAKMGRVVSQCADYAVITSDNPRSEDPLLIIDDIVKGMAGDAFCVVADRQEAIRHALCMSMPQDVVLIAGKGHERYQIIGSKTIPFDDRQAVRQALTCGRTATPCL